MIAQEVVRRAAVYAASALSAPIITISSFSLIDNSDEDYMYLLQASNAAEENYYIVERVREEFNDVEDEDVVNPATTGKGLNLLLINDIQTEGFVKEYLTQCVENMDGELDLGASMGLCRDAYADVTTIIGINISETGFYSAGDGMTLPRTTLKQGSDGAPVWDGNVNSLKNAGYSYWSAGDTGMALGGPLQFTPGPNKYSAIDSKSKYNNSATNPYGVGVGDCYLFSDAICGVNMMINAALDKVPAKNEGEKYNTGFLQLAGNLVHNKGPEGIYQIYGIDYSRIRGRSGSPSGGTPYVDFSGGSYTEVDDIFSEIRNDLVNAGVSQEYLLEVALDWGYFTQFFPLMVNGWYINSMAKQNILNHSDRAIDRWNAYFPDNPVSNKNELSEALDPYVKTLSEVIGLPPAECDRIYGTVNGDYQNWSDIQHCRGNTFKVTDKRSDVYKNAAGSKIVYTFDGISMQHMFSVCAGAEYVYAKMLRYAGVGIDPTDPSTYMNMVSSGGEWAPSGYNDVVEKLKSMGLNVSGLPAERLNIVDRAYKLYDIIYHQCRGAVCVQCGARCTGKCFNGMARPDHLDCSSFVWRVYRDAGYDTSPIPTATGSYPGGLVPVDSLDAMRPGDIIWKRGHVFIFLGVTGDQIATAEAHSHNVLSDFSFKSVSNIDNNRGVWHYARYPGLQ